MRLSANVNRFHCATPLSSLGRMIDCVVLWVGHFTSVMFKSCNQFCVKLGNKTATNACA